MSTYSPDAGPTNSSNPDTSQPNSSRAALAAASAIANAPGEVYVQRLLNNIYTMLAYVNSNGIALPPELRAKLDVLFAHPDFQNHNLASRFSSEVGRLWRRW